jgi:hypothetical protein
LCMDPNDPAADTAGLGIPGHVIADFETFLHVRLLTHRVTPPRLAVSSHA